MQPEKLFQLKRSVEAFRNAFCQRLLQENKNIQNIYEMLYDIVHHLSIAAEYSAMNTMATSDVDLEEFKYKFDCAIDDARENIESIQATMRTNEMCDKLKMAMTGACLLIKSELETL